MNKHNNSSVAKYHREIRDNAIASARGLKRHGLKGGAYLITMARNANRALVRELRCCG